MKATKLVIGASMLIAMIAATGTVAADHQGPYSLAQCVKDGGTPNEACGDSGHFFNTELTQCITAIQNQENVAQQCTD